jgi:hypothetical protein
VKEEKRNATQLSLFDADQAATVPLEGSENSQKVAGNNVVPTEPKKKTKERERQQRRHRVRPRKAADAGQNDVGNKHAKEKANMKQSEEVNVKSGTETTESGRTPQERTPGPMIG